MTHGGFFRLRVVKCTMRDASVFLVVDDDEDVRLALRLFLEGEGFVVEEATNGNEALKRLRAGLRPQLIVLDLMMPVMTGWEFREQQRASVELKDIPVVIFTAAGLTTGAVDDLTVLPKPVDTTRLLETLKRVAGEAAT
jgi:CheY-like chemotaxis protein